MDKRSRSFYVLAAFFGLFLVFLYGPTITIAILSFQGPQGGLTFPMRGVSLHWFQDLFRQQAVGDIWGSFARSLTLGLMVMATTVVISVMGGLAFRKRFPGSSVIFYLIITSLVIPSILISLGVGLIFSQSGLAVHWSTSGFGAQLTWTLPFGLLIMFAVFNRFDKSYEEAARDQGATAWQTVRYVVLPIIAPMLIGVALFGFTLSYDEFARTLLTAGSYNTLPLEIYGMTTNVTTPVIFALGTLTTVFSFLIIGMFLAVVVTLNRRRSRFGSDAGKGLGPAAIQGAADGAAALPGLNVLFDRTLESDQSVSAVIIACFDDTGLFELKARSPVPVIGIGEAAYHVASVAALKFSVVTTLPVSVPVLEDNLRRVGLGPRCARVRASDVPVLDLEDPTSDARQRIETEIESALLMDGIGAIALGCAGMADLATDLTAKFHVPVIDGVASAVRLAEMVAR
eukprot:g1440.t1